MLARVIDLYRSGARALDFVSPAVDLMLRLWVANAFFKSGLTKIANFDSTISLFENEYNVPLLPPELAAYLGTGAELVLPVFLALGLGTRAAAIALFVFNIVAVVSYPDLSAAGLKEHIFWGVMMLVTIVHGPGKLSLDYWIDRASRGAAGAGGASGGTQWAH
jgi:putative oxidoreductase